MPGKIDKPKRFRRFRDSLTGWFTSAEDAAHRPGETQEGNYGPSVRELRMRQILMEALKADDHEPDLQRSSAALRRAIRAALNPELDHPPAKWQKP